MMKANARLCAGEKGLKMKTLFFSAVSLCLSVLCGAVSGLKADNTFIFYSDGAIVPGDSYQYVRVKNTAVVQMTGGTIANYLLMFDSSRTVIQGGDIVQGVDVWGTSTIEQSGGSIGGPLVLHESGFASIREGSISWMEAYEYSRANIYGGSLGQGGAARNRSVVNVYGGSIGNVLGVQEFGTINIYGGSIHLLAGQDSGLINIYGSSLHYSPDGGSYGGGVVTGFYGDGTAMSLQINSGQYSHVSLHEIPEPATFSLLALGGLGLLRRKRKQGPGK